MVKFVKLCGHPEFFLIAGAGLEFITIMQTELVTEAARICGSDKLLEVVGRCNSFERVGSSTKAASIAVRVMSVGVSVSYPH